MTNLKKEIMEKLKKDEVKMRPKEFFVIIKILIYVLVGGLIMATVFFLNLSFYLPRRRTPGPRFWNNALDGIPWLYVVAAIVLFIGAIYFIEKFTSAYKKSLIYVLLTILVAVIMAGYLLSLTGLNRRFEQRPGWRKIYNEDYRGKRMQQRPINQIPIHHF